jgi:hypothetical protein
MTTAATPAHDLEAAAARRVSGPRADRGGSVRKILAADNSALRSAAGAPIVTAPTGLPPTMGCSGRGRRPGTSWGSQSCG